MDVGEGNDLAEIDLTYSPTSGISRARRVLGRLVVCIIQVLPNHPSARCRHKQPHTGGIVGCARMVAS